MMEFIDLKSQYALLKERINGRIQTVLEHGQYIMGPEVQELEERLGETIGVKHCIGVANGTDALVIALRALGVGHGDMVVCPSFTFFATAESVALVGGIPIFADADESTFNISIPWLQENLPQLKERYGPSLKALIVVDLFGAPVNYSEIEPICDELEIALVADAAQSMGASWQGRKTGSFGTVATTSFFPAKPLGGYGDGGAIFTNSDEIAEICCSIRVHGKGSGKYENVRIGTNSRLDTIQAAILLEKLAVLEQEIDKRQWVAKRYSESLGDKFELQQIGQSAQSAWAQYSLLAPEGKREEVRAILHDRGIPTQVYYPKPLHLQRAFAHLVYQEGDLPVSESLSRNIFSLPMGPYVDAANQVRVIEALVAR